MIMERTPYDHALSSRDVIDFGDAHRFHEARIALPVIFRQPEADDLGDVVHDGMP